MSKLDEFHTALGHVIRHYDKEHHVFELDPSQFAVLQNINGHYYCVTVTKKEEINVLPVLVNSEMPELLNDGTKE